jgi:DNA-binding LytR/AlgR family response regulator
MKFDFSKQKEKKLAIKEKTQISFLNYDQILFFECSGSLVFIYHSQSVKPLTFCATLNDIETKLNCYGFLRINHNTIINMFHVKKMCTKKHEVHLSNEFILHVSTRKWHKVKCFVDL